MYTLIFKLKAWSQPFLWFLLPTETTCHRKMYSSWRLVDCRFSRLIGHTFPPFGRICRHLPVFDACKLTASWDRCADGYWFLIFLSLLIWWNLAHWCGIQLIVHHFVFVISFYFLIIWWNIRPLWILLHTHWAYSWWIILLNTYWRLFSSENWFTLSLS